MGTRCLILNFFSKAECPYAQFYIRALERAGFDYDVAYFERYGRREPLRHEILFQEPCPTGGPKSRKIATMWRYARFARSLLERGSYGKVFVLTTVPAVMAADVLLRDYGGNYFLDIRDYTHESLPPYRAVVDRLVARSYATALSSRGFLRFLDSSDKFVFSHNVPLDMPPVRREPDLRRRPLDVGFVGSIRYFEENAELIRQLSGDARFRLSYHGTQTNGCDLRSWCLTEGYGDVIFTGKFDNAAKAKIYESVDVINSIYGISGLETTTALPNRLYDAALYGCPLVVSRRTYLAEVVGSYGLGLAIDVLHEDVRGALVDYVSRFDSAAFEDGRSRLISDAREDMAAFEGAIRRYVEG